MKKSQLSEGQIIKIIASQESGRSVSDICRVSNRPDTYCSKGFVPLALEKNEEQ